MKTLNILCLTALLLTGCDDDDTGDTGDTGDTASVVSMVVDNHMVLCNAEGQWLCPSVQIDGGDWSALYCGINNLDYQWGTTYTLTAELIGNSDPAMDGCGDAYELVSIEDESFDGASRAFELSWVYGINITTSGSGGLLMDSTPFTCADEAVCDALAAVSPDWATTYTLSLENPAKSGDPLILTAIAQYE